MELLLGVAARNALLTAFVLVGTVIWLSYAAANTLTRGRVHGSAIAIAVGLLLAWIGGVSTGGEQGLADVPACAGLGLLGGGMLRDFAIVATAFGADIRQARSAGVPGTVALLLGVILSFAVGAVVAWTFGYTDAVSITTIGAGAATYIVGPVTGGALGATSDVMALSIAAGLVKAILVMIGTPFIAPYIGLNNPQAAMVYGGLMGTTSGVTGGLAATDPALVPYGALTSTFYTGLGCLLCPSILFLAVRALL